jgi:radical SAM superfamily enzyme YgiQ (UPF0313 family)
VAIRVPTLIHNLTTVVTPSLPIGLAYVVAAIQDLCSVQGIDAIAERPEITEVTRYDDDLSILGLTPAETAARIERAPDVCFISSMFSAEWLLTRDLIAKVRARYPECVIVGGGEHYNAAADYSLANSNVDVCVLGEGEATARDLIERMTASGGSVPLDLPGTVVRDRATGRVIRNEPRARIKDLASVPLPAWESFNVHAFLDRGIGQFDAGRRGTRSMPFVASRGCPYRCTFCSNEFMWGTRWTPRKPEDVLGEWQLYIDRYGANHFDSCDLTAIVKRSWIVQFTKLLIEADLGVTWGMPSGTRSEVLDEETLPLLKRSGCRDITYAPESGSPHILEAMDKRISKKDMLASMRRCHAAGIVTKANIIFGHPDERRRHVLETLGFIVQIALTGVEDLMVTEISPYPGTVIFDRLLAEGRIRMDDEYFRSLSFMTSLGTSSSYARYSRAELQMFRLVAWVLFYSLSHAVRPVRIARMARDFGVGYGSTRLSKGLINMSKRRRSLRSARAIEAAAAVSDTRA